jgi:mannosyl-3-phosphoglycerate phosphatase family protein
MPKLVIVTDLDGSLLHSKTYSFEAAAPALELLRKKNIPLVLCSSKTRAELELYRERLCNRHPFIIENGGGIYIPEEYFPFVMKAELRNGYRVISLGTPYREIRKQFTLLRDKLGVSARGFGDMTSDEVASLTNLPKEEAALAREREYGEPFVFSGVPDERFLQAIEKNGFQWTQGRLYHMMGNYDKGKAVAVLRNLYAQQFGNVITMGLGDSLNDLPFLLVVDRPVLIRKKEGSFDSRIDLKGLYRTEGIGPEGWNEAVIKLLRQC